MCSGWKPIGIRKHEAFIKTMRIIESKKLVLKEDLEEYGEDSQKLACSKQRNCRNKKNHRFQIENGGFGPSGGAQTHGLAVPNRALYPLSYTWMLLKAFLTF